MRKPVDVLIGAVVVVLPAVLYGCHANVGGVADVHSERIAPADYGARVRTMPLFKRADAAYRGHDYRTASALLTQLSADKSLSSSELNYCREQIAICEKAQRPRSAAVAAVRAAPSGPADRGPRALAIVCHELGVKASADRLAVTAGTGPNGTTMSGLARAARSVGLKAEGVQAARAEIPEQEMPAVAWVAQGSGHYIAVLKIDGAEPDATATVHDPNTPNEVTDPLERLLRDSKGCLLLERIEL